MPQGAELLRVEVQEGTPCIWALVDDAHSIMERRIEVSGTGHTMDPGVTKAQYVGTFFLDALVFHVFDLGEHR